MIIHDEDSARYVVQQMLDSFQACAAGIWRVETDWLEQLAFASTNDLTEIVATEFEQQTKRVPRSATSLAIVHAVQTHNIVIATPDGPLTGSGSWLQRFGAATSLSIPCGTSPAAGVIAIATIDPVKKDDRRYQSMKSFCEELIVR